MGDKSAFPEWRWVEVWPSNSHASVPRLENFGGMTMRQWYKGMALPLAMDGVTFPDDEISREKMAAQIARETGRMADAMLAEDKEHEEKTHGG